MSKEEKSKLMERPNWPIYYMDIAVAVSKRSNCIRRQVGAVLVLDNRIVSTGYNGTPRGLPNCYEGGCERCANTTNETSGKNIGECLCNHAEENVITQAAYHGVRTNGAVLYCMLTPCLVCARMIINSGICQVIYMNEYSHPMVGKVLADAGIDMRPLPAPPPNHPQTARNALLTNIRYNLVALENEARNFAKDREALAAITQKVDWIKRDLELIGESAS